MNSKIEELKEKAKYWFANHYNFSVAELNGEIDQRFQKIIDEKFLELIILECAEVVHNKNKLALMQRAKIYVFPEDIASHFGIHYDKHNKD